MASLNGAIDVELITQGGKHQANHRSSEYIRGI